MPLPPPPHGHDSIGRFSQSYVESALSQKEQGSQFQHGRQKPRQNRRSLLAVLGALRLRPTKGIVEGTGRHRRRDGRLEFVPGRRSIQFWSTVRPSTVPVGPAAGDPFPSVRRWKFVARRRRSISSHFQERREARGEGSADHGDRRRARRAGKRGQERGRRGNGCGQIRGGHVRSKLRYAHWNYEDRRRSQGRQEADEDSEKFTGHDRFAPFGSEEADPTISNKFPDHRLEWRFQQESIGGRFAFGFYQKETT